MRTQAVLSTLIFLPLAFAAPTPSPLFGIDFSGTEADGSPTPLSQADITNDFQHAALFSRTAYCPTSSITNWSCGAPCDALPGVKVLTAGGDNKEVPDFFIAQDPATNSIVVAHQGTDPDELLSDLNDAEFAKVDINSTLFPNAGSGVQVHDGFGKTQGRTADLVLSTVQSALAATGAKNVLVTGHSLGAAVATMDAVMLQMNLDPSINITTVVFGLPRGGNQAWADLVDSTIGSQFAHVTNQDDPVPTVPPQDFGFQHPAGEAHITAVDATSGQATMEACPGQENENCSDGNSILDSSVQNHLGPYFNGISFGSDACPGS